MRNGQDRNEITDIINKFFEDMLTELSPGLYIAIDVYTRKSVGKELPKAAIENPRDFYEVLTSLISESAIKILDTSILKLLKKKGIKVRGSILYSLKHGNVEPLLQASRTYSMRSEYEG